MTAPLDLDALSALVQPLDEAARTATRDRIAAQARPAGALGRLDELAVWLSGAQGVSPPRDPLRARLVLFAGDHGVAAAGVSAYPPGATARGLDRVRAGSAVVNALARTADATVRAVDVAIDSDVPAGPPPYRVRRGSGRIDREDALALADAERAFAVGAAVADEEVDEGADLLLVGDLGVAGTTVAATLVAALTDTEPVRVIGRGSGIDDHTWMRKVTAIRDGLRRARPFTGDPVALLAVGGGADVAALAGFLVQAATRRTPVVLDGVMSAAAALVASAVAPAAPAWWLAAHRSTEPAHAIALAELGMAPVLDLGIRTGEGAGALAVLPLLRAAVRACADTAPADPADRLTRTDGADPDADPDPSPDIPDDVELPDLADLPDLVDVPDLSGLPNPAALPPDPPTDPAPLRPDPPSDPAALATDRGTEPSAQPSASPTDRAALPTDRDPTDPAALTTGPAALRPDRSADPDAADPAGPERRSGTAGSG